MEVAGEGHLRGTECLTSLVLCDDQFVCDLQEVNVEFEAFSISDSDYDGIKRLLQQVLLCTPYAQTRSSEKIQARQHRCQLAPLL